MKPASFEEQAARTRPWLKFGYQQSERTGPPPVRIEALIRFGERWGEFWSSKDWYIGDGLPFAVLDEIAAIENRPAWDRGAWPR